MAVGHVVLSARGRAQVILHDVGGVPNDVFLKALYIYLAINRTYFLFKLPLIGKIPYIGTRFC